MTCLKILCVVGWLTLPVGTPLDDGSKRDLERFQGSWQATAILTDDGRSAPVEDLENTRLVVTGDRFVLKGKEYTITGRITIDGAKTPKTIDVTLDAKEGQQPVKLLGIYCIDGETRKSCFAMPDKNRPTSFPMSPKGHVQFEWKRQSERN